VAPRPAADAVADAREPEVCARPSISGRPSPSSLAISLLPTDLAFVAESKPARSINKFEIPVRPNVGAIDPPAAWPPRTVRRPTHTHYAARIRDFQTTRPNARQVPPTFKTIGLSSGASWWPGLTSLAVNGVRTRRSVFGRISRRLYRFSLGRPPVERRYLSKHRFLHIHIKHDINRVHMVNVRSIFDNCFWSFRAVQLIRDFRPAELWRDRSSSAPVAGKLREKRSDRYGSWRESAIVENATLLLRPAFS